MYQVHRPSSTSTSTQATSTSASTSTQATSTSTHPSSTSTQATSTSTSTQPSSTSTRFVLQVHVKYASADRHNTSVVQSTEHEYLSKSKSNVCSVCIQRCSAFQHRHQLDRLIFRRKSSLFGLFSLTWSNSEKIGWLDKNLCIVGGTGSGSGDSFTSISITGVPAVLKFQKCPEFEIVLKFYSFNKNVLKMAFDAQ